MSAINRDRPRPVTAHREVALMERPGANAASRIWKECTLLGCHRSFWALPSMCSLLSYKFGIVTSPFSSDTAGSAYWLAYLFVGACTISGLEEVNCLVAAKADQATARLERISGSCQ